ncbi:MAG: large repetitive protein [Sulfurimonas sp.]|nr:large repetitive protein [Sulfurimonadaceae bacterium]
MLLLRYIPPPKAKKPCHCNIFFKHKIRLILLLNHFIPRCPFYTTWFAFRRTGVHPPL